MSKEYDFTLKDGAEVFSSDPYYDFFDGGYIDATELLKDKETAKAVEKARILISQFFANIEPEEGWS